jgi:FMN-dependent oxidoreductase (nitrilotriacetate monooxygenase family)
MVTLHALNCTLVTAFASDHRVAVIDGSHSTAIETADNCALNSPCALEEDPVARNEKMILSAFLAASNVSTFTGSWLYPTARSDYLSSEYYIDMARLLDQGGIDLAFYDDRLAMPAIYGDSVAETMRTGARAVKLDLLTVLGLMAGGSRELGLGATYSTSYYAPYHVARAFASLDHLSNGRAAWNIVTSVNRSEADNFGSIEVAHDERYDRAEEFLDIVTQLWDSWDPEAIVYDRKQRIYAHSESAHRIDYSGRWHKSMGPLTLPRPPQRWPLLIQAGQSGRGRDFGAKWADLVFTVGHSIDAAIGQRSDQRGRAKAFGRTEEQIRVLPLVSVIVGETEKIAKEKLRYLDELFDPIAALVIMSEVTNVDFSQIGLDEPITEEVLAGVTGAQGPIRAMIEASKSRSDRPVTLRDLAIRRGTIGGQAIFVGTGYQVADQMEEWFERNACDGFAINASHFPGTFEDFIRMVVPELRRRNLIHRERPRGSLRERLDLMDRFNSRAVAAKKVLDEDK